MKTKLRQVTDSIHGTIYLSDMESELISTPYFYRLHDIYQSSTVYMTFPSNRTKRYEHSLGTMELASSMFFSAISNANSVTRDKLFEKLKETFVNICDELINKANMNNAPYLTKCEGEVNSVFGGFGRVVKNNIVETILNKGVFAGINNNCLADSALDYYQFYPTDVKENQANNSILNLFLYRCTLQALRIVALFHDVGHPPYSHIIESVLERLYKECADSEISKTWDGEKKEEIKQILEPYMSDDEEVAYKCHMLCTQSLCRAEDQFHEKIGLSLLQSAIDDVIPQLVKSTSSLSAKADKITCILYYIVVAEFAMAIHTEMNDTFCSIHKIVDGTVDSDRLDYIMRDSLNSGVDWGEIPYKRLINSAKLICINDQKGCFAIAYPRKVADDIIDLLLVRFKIFARINLHHRCVKTATALQAAVYELAKDYLSQGDNCVNPDVSTLWKALGLERGNRSTRMIQWNDSWLISMLHTALVNLSSYEDGNRVCEHRDLIENLEEILLNRKRFYSLLKRGGDCKLLINKAFEKAQISDEKLKSLKIREKKKYYASYDDEESKSTSLLAGAKENAMESIKRIRRLSEIKNTGDFELLYYFLPPEKYGTLCQIFEKVLDELKRQNILADYKITVNKLRRKTGLPSHATSFDEIYLYDDRGYDKFNENLTLRSQIESIEKNVPWIFIYFVPIDTGPKIEELMETIVDQLAIELGNTIGERYVELFETGK